MGLRLLLGRTTLAGHPWWDAPLSSAFHLVLAAFLGVLGPPPPARGAKTS